MDNLSNKYRVLVLNSSLSYGTTVYFKHSFRDIEFSYFTEEEYLPNILKELSEKVEKEERMSIDGKRN